MKVLAMKNTIDEVICNFHDDLEATEMQWRRGRLPRNVVEQMVKINHPAPSELNEDISKFSFSRIEYSSYTSHGITGEGNIVSSAKT